MSNEFYNTVGGSNCSSSRWLTEEVFKLIDMVQRDEAIYNPRHKYYFCRPYVENFWREVDLKLEKNPGASLAKWTNLRISFRREYTNYLEEKVPPCWSYFDRMFFLHPYLRKKHQQPKSLDSQVQDALVQISSLSNRLQRERAVAAAAATATATLNASSSAEVQHSQQPLDNYLEYFDDTEPNNSELEEIMEEEQRARFQNIDAHSPLNNDIKSECDDNVDDYEAEPPHVESDEADEGEANNYALNTLATCSSSNGHVQEKRHQMRLQHLNRLQTRSYHEDLRAKRPRSQESISSSQQSSVAQRLLSVSMPSTHSNVSFVRPTFAKPMELVSTTSSSVAAAHSVNESDISSASTGPAISALNSTPMMHHQRHLPHHRLEIAAISSGSNSTGSVAATTTAANAASAGNATAGTPTAHLELCDCKTDPDAMFLMSLLPDIQKLNGRDRGKIKIAFQNILQDYLYPD